MINGKYIRISPAQAIWANQSGRTVFKKLNESNFTPVETNQELKQNQDFYISLSKQQIEHELDIASQYQTTMTMLSLMHLISAVLLLFNYNTDINTMMVTLGFIWVYTGKNIIIKTINFNKEKSRRKSFYLFGRVYF